MSYLASSIFGKEFINYRKNNAHYERTRFSSKIRNQGIGLVPIVVDSVENDLSLILGGKSEGRNKKYGKEYILHMDIKTNDFLTMVTNDINNVEKDFLKGKKIKMGIEEGTLIEMETTIGDIYKKYKNKKDNILYILITQETTVYGYILSILRYLGLSF